MLVLLVLNMFYLTIFIDAVDNLFSVFLKCYYKHFLVLAVLYSCFYSASTNNNSLETPRECGSMDIRNECSNLERLHGCTVINGYLNIALIVAKTKTINNSTEICNYDQYQFKLLREITEYLIFFDVKGITSIRNLFPNLTVIRGRKLFLNYALGISSMPDLELLEFQSLIAIQRGHVFIGSCPKLCYLNNINWERLTLSTGENHIFPVTSETCALNGECENCTSGYCWSNNVCQRFENDNLIDFTEGIGHCHEQCLGGCYNETNHGCVVCKGLTDHGSCVKQCPSDKYLVEVHRRCYTKDECVKELKLFIYENTCVQSCPSGFASDNNSICKPCAIDNPCLKICQPCPLCNHAITIYNLDDSDKLRDCELINGSLIITLRNKINQLELLRNFAGVREIRGHLKIYRSSYITSLKFLHNLKQIDGTPLENGHYGIIIYGNRNLQELWNPQSNFEIKRGGIFIHHNEKLCNHIIKEFQNVVIHNQMLNSLQVSDQEVLCGSAKLMLQINVKSHNSIELFWPKDSTSDEIEIIYRQLPSIYSEQSELDSDVCTRINWQRHLTFKSELKGNGTHFSYVVNNLQPNTDYGVLIKTFGTNYKNDSRSELKIVITKTDIPAVPDVNIIKKTDSSLTVQFQSITNTNEVVLYYRLFLYELRDDSKLLNVRDYCKQPLLFYEDFSMERYTKNIENEDYNDCCARLEETAEDMLFMQNIQQMYRCSLDSKENCLNTIVNKSVQNKPLQSLKYDRTETIYTLHHLERFTVYSLQVQACNEIGCSSYRILNERTNYSIVGDKVDNLKACRVPGSTEYRIYFTEPKHSNSLIVSYIIHYRIYSSDSTTFKSHLSCVTSLQHAKSNYQYTVQLNDSFNQIALRVHSLAGDVFIDWVNVSSCQTDDADDVKKLNGNGMIYSSHSRGLNIFLIFFLIGAAGTLIWVIYKRRYWRKLSEIYRYFSQLRHWNTMAEDRQILVDGFEVVQFHNIQ